MDNTATQPSVFMRVYDQISISDWIRKLSGYGDGNRTAPIMVCLEPETSSSITNKSPVRIYAGLDSKQYRAERLFVWSILQVRDLARHYEIYLMKDLKGFERKGWTSSYSGYRFAVPDFSGGKGRAIYNDVSEVYLSDPAELFDCDMNGAALLSTGRLKSGVSLMDCEKLSNIWSLQDAKTRSNHSYFDLKVHSLASIGNLPSNWGVDDITSGTEKTTCLYQAKAVDQSGDSSTSINKLQTLTPQDLIEIENAADSARFTLFTEQLTSTRYKELLAFYETMHEVGRPETGHDAKQTFSGVSLTEHIEPIAHLLKLADARTVLDFGSGKGKLYKDAPGYSANSRFKTIPNWDDALVTCYDPGYQPFSEPVQGTFDVVISTDVVEHIPEEDIAWVLDKIFAYATHSVYVVAACYPAHKHLPDGTNAHCTLQPPEWWVGQMEQSARHYPAINWVLCTQEKGWLIFQKRKKLRKKGMRNRFFSGSNLKSQEYKAFDMIQFLESA